MKVAPLGLAVCRIVSVAEGVARAAGAPRV
jgi:hypothetical protein